MAHRFFDDLNDLAVVIGATHAIPRGPIVGDFLNEERCVSPVFSLAFDNIAQIRLEDFVSNYKHKVITNVLLNGQERMREPKRIALMTVGVMEAPANSSSQWLISRSLR